MFLGVTSFNTVTTYQSSASYMLNLPRDLQTLKQYTMEPANHHHQHQLQELFTGYYSSLLSRPEYMVSGTNIGLPPAGTVFDCNTYLTETIPSSREPWQAARASIDHGLSFFDTNSFTFTQRSANELLVANIKDEMPGSFPKLSEMIYSPSNVEESPFCSTKYKEEVYKGVMENRWLSNFSSGQLSLGEMCNNVSQNSPSLQKSFRNVLPISTSELCSSVSSYLDLNAQAEDHLTHLCGGTNSSLSSHTGLGYLAGGHKSSPSSSSSKFPAFKTRAFKDGVGRRKGNSSTPGSKKSPVETKKQQPPSRSSCPTLKVRKEKLGDRIAELQRLVAPYGKTDTASVLTEAIGYIQFLHDQVQTLNMPYMKSPNIKPATITQMRPGEEHGKGQPKRDLRSRGLCLVPVSCASYFNTYNGGTQ